MFFWEDYWVNKIIDYCFKVIRCLFGGNWFGVMIEWKVYYFDGGFVVFIFDIGNNVVLMGLFIDYLFFCNYCFRVVNEGFVIRDFDGIGNNSIVR